MRFHIFEKPTAMNTTWIQGLMHSQVLRQCRKIVLQFFSLYHCECCCASTKHVLQLQQFSVGRVSNISDLSDQTVSLGLKVCLGYGLLQQESIRPGNTICQIQQSLFTMRASSFPNIPYLHFSPNIFIHFVHINKTIDKNIL